MTVGEGEIFEKMVVYLPEEGMRKTPGLELVAFFLELNVQKI